MEARELLRRYAARQRDFSHENLSRQSFRGQELSGADFSGANIRGSDFTKANLKTANFLGAKAGISYLLLAFNLIPVVVVFCSIWWSMSSFYYDVFVGFLLAVTIFGVFIFVLKVWKTEIILNFISLSCTRFKGADLTEVDFSKAILITTDMREAIILRTRFYKVKGLGLALLGDSILKQKSVKKLLVSGNGNKKSYVGMNLKGANLQRFAQLISTVATMSKPVTKMLWIR